MDPEDIGRLIIVTLSALTASLFLTALLTTGKHQDINRIIMWVGFIILLAGTATRNLVSGEWIPPEFILPAMGVQIVGNTCLIIGVALHVLNWWKKESLHRQHREIDREIGSHR